MCFLDEGSAYTEFRHQRSTSKIGHCCISNRTRTRQAFGSELAVERFDEAVVRRLARPREVQHDIILVSPDIEIAGDELRSLVDADRLGIADIPALRQTS